MYIYVGEYEDDGMGPILDELVCSCCGRSNSSYQNYVVDKIDLPYRVLVMPMKCRLCGHIDSIVAKSKKDFIDLTCFPGAYNLFEDRQKAVERQEKREYKYKECVKAHKEHIKVNFKSIIEKVKESFRITVLLGTIVLSIVMFLLFLFVLSISSFVLFIFLYKLIGLITVNSPMQLYLSMSIVLTVSVIVEPFLKRKMDLFVGAVTWPIIVNKFLGLSHLMRVILFVVITIVDLSNNTYFLNHDKWILIKEAVYPAIVTSLLAESYIKAIKKTLKKKDSIKCQENSLAENCTKNDNCNEEHNRVVDEEYLDILLSYFGQATICEMEQFNSEIYDLIKRDFMKYFIDNSNSENTATVSDMIQWYIKEFKEGIQ